MFDVSPNACALITYKKETCKYNKNTFSCTSNINLSEDTCETPGINKYACYKLE